MRKLTVQERIALVEVGPPGEGPVSPETFAELERLGWGYWDIGPSFLDRLLRRKSWYVTAAGLAALEYDRLARQERITS